MASLRNTKMGLAHSLALGYQFGMGIRELREGLGLSQAELAEKVGTSQPQIDRLEKGQRKLSKDWAIRLAPHLKVKAQELLFAEEAQPVRLASHENVRERFAQGRRQIVTDRDNSVTVPEHDIRASAGPGTIVEEETEVAEWSLPRDYVRRTLSLRGNALAVIEVVGDSMEPTLQTGDKILVDLGDKNIAMPGVFALYDGDATVVKRVEKVPGGVEIIHLISDNPLHSNYRVPAETVNIAGRVVWYGRRL